MPLVENCIVNSGRAARENRWRKTVHIKVEKCLKCVLKKKRVSLPSFTVLSPAREAKSE